MKYTGRFPKVWFLTLMLVFFAFSSGCGMFSGSDVDAVVEELGYGDAPEPIDLEQGEYLRLVVRNPGSGGYVFSGTVFDPAVLDLVKVYDQKPESGLMGDFGSRNYLFHAVKTGETEVVIKIARPGQEPEEYQRQPVTVE